jgi:3-oxoacyl-[acyl-carrier protein] reductase
MNGSLEGKVALVTGSSRGIGRAIALELARRGADIIVNYRSHAEAAEAVAEAIRGLGRRAAVLQADVSRAEEAAALVNEGRRALGGLHIVVNNAGITRDNLLMRMEESEWEAVLRVNLSGVFHVCKAAIRPLMRQRWGRIINIGSVSGLMGQVGQTNYAATKAGLIGFSKSLAREVGSRGITVNVIAPGFVPTEMTAKVDEGIQAQIKALIPLQRFGKAEEIAHAVAFLASEEASYITGVVLPVDGGLSM